MKSQIMNPHKISALSDNFFLTPHVTNLIQFNQYLGVSLTETCFCLRLYGTYYFLIQEIHFSCHGKMKRWICNFSIGDLPRALDSNCVWMNKFDIKVDPRPILCMHEYLTQQMLDYIFCKKKLYIINYKSKQHSNTYTHAFV